jgi:two-component system, cell cycle response regulator
LEEILKHNIEDDIITLGFAARLLLTNLDRDIIIDRAFQSMADFAISDKVGLFLHNHEEDLYCVGGLINGRVEKRSFKINKNDMPWLQINADKNHGYFSVDHAEDIPIPIIEGGIHGRKCLCAPLVAANNQVVGMVTFEYAAEFFLPTIMIQSLLLLLTIIAVALETARLFQQAVYDGLTGLYVRRYFDLRLVEEENRIKRYGGRLAILMMDIDHFKKINDRYGHQEGDSALCQVADIIRSSIRRELDMPCRYGGEEFVVIMTDTDLAGALIVAERIRHSIQNHVFKTAEGPIRITLSGGVAFTDQQGFLTGQELLKKADNALYRAKENGRNQIQVWER